MEKSVVFDKFKEYIDKIFENREIKPEKEQKEIKKVYIDDREYENWRKKK